MSFNSCEIKNTVKAVDKKSLNGRENHTPLNSKKIGRIRIAGIKKMT